MLALPEEEHIDAAWVRRQARRDELWRRGILAWKLRPEQKLLLSLLKEAPTDLAVFNISRRFGKSTTCVVYVVEEAIKRAQHIRYATAFLTDLQNFILPIFEWCLSDCPEEVAPIFIATKKQFEFPNGSVIKLVGLDKNPNGLRGNAIDILVGDEAAFVKNLDYLYRSIIIPATMKRKFKLIFPSTPPESPEHFWAKELIPKARKRNTYVELTIDAISDLSAEEKRRLLDEVGGEFSSTAQREFYCKIVVDATRSLAPSFEKDVHVAAFEIPDIHWTYFGDTGGTKDKTVFLQVGFDHVSQRILFRSELEFEPNTASPVIIRSFKDRYGEAKTLTMDGSGQLIIDYSTLGLTASSPQKDDFTASIGLLNTALHNRQVLIHPDCELLVRTLAGGLLTKSRLDFERTPDLGHCDAAAAMIYALRGVDRMTDLRPKPKPSEVFVVHREDNLAQNLKNLSWRR